MTTPQTPTRSATTKENMTATSTGLIYVSRLLTDRAMEHLQSLGAPDRVGPKNHRAGPNSKPGIAGAGAAVLTLTERVDADLLAAAGPQLKVIANVAVGFDNIDLDAAAAAGVTVTNTPGVLDRATADHTFALILAATRRITEGDRLIRSRRTLGVGAADAGRTRHQRRRHPRHPRLRPHRQSRGPPRPSLRHDRRRHLTGSGTPAPSRTASPSSTPRPCSPTATSSASTPRSPRKPTT